MYRRLRGVARRAETEPPPAEGARSEREHPALVKADDRPLLAVVADAPRERRGRPVSRGGREPVRPVRTRRRRSWAATLRAARARGDARRERPLPGPHDLDLLRVSQYRRRRPRRGPALPLAPRSLRRRLPAELAPPPLRASPAFLREHDRPQLLAPDDELRRPHRAGADRGGRAVRRRLVRGQARPAAGLASSTARRTARSWRSCARTSTSASRGSSTSER